jgi:membrane associated rhomboid family serine protease
MLFPNQPLFLFLIPVPIPAKYAVLLLGAFAFIASLTNIMPGISNIGHLGGLLFGLIYLRGRGWWLRLPGMGR